MEEGKEEQEEEGKEGRIICYSCVHIDSLGDASPCNGCVYPDFTHYERACPVVTFF